MSKIQTKHIPTEFILEAVSHLSAIPELCVNHNRRTRELYPARVVVTRGVRPQQIAALWPDIPEKVIRSKMRKMERDELLFESFDRYTLWPKGEERLNGFRIAMGLSLWVPDDFLNATLTGSIDASHG